MNNPPQGISSTGSQPPSWGLNSTVMQASIINEVELVGRLANPCPTVNTGNKKKKKTPLQVVVLEIQDYKTVRKTYIYRVHESAFEFYVVLTLSADYFNKCWVFCFKLFELDSFDSLKPVAVLN